MAKLKGTILFQGTLGEIVFYPSKFGYLARTKGTLNRDRIANDPAFKRTRENNSEFGNAVRSAKLLRNTVRKMGRDVFDNQLTPRLNQLMAKIKAMDVINECGQRNVADAMEQPGVKNLLHGFNFNDRSPVDSILPATYVLDTGNGTISMQGFIPARDSRPPEGATHLVVQSGWARIDFRDEKSELVAGEPVYLPVDNRAADVVAGISHAPILEGTSLFLVKIAFLQEVNGERYGLQNGAYNAMAVAGVK